MLIKIQATTAVLNQSEMLEAIPNRIMEKIKIKNPNPYFQAYSIAKEGVSKPRVIGEGTQTIAWPKKAIQTLGQIIKTGLQFFSGHNADNSTDGRRRLGQVVGKIAKDIGGVLNQIVIGYFPNRKEAENCDVCSIEADVEMTEVPGGMSIAEKVLSLTGIALGNSAQEHPAFEGAIKLGALQCFEPIEDNKAKNKMEEIQMPQILTFSDIKKAVQDMNIWPNQLFTEDQIKKDNDFGKIFESNKSLSKQVETLTKEKGVSEETITKLEKQTLAIDAIDRMKKLIPIGATDKQKSFIDKAFKPDNMDDLSDDNLKKFVDDSMNNYKEFASVFNDSENKDDLDLDDKNDSENADKTDVDSAVENVLTS